MNLTKEQLNGLGRTDVDMEETYIDLEDTKDMDYGDLNSGELIKLGKQIIE